MGADQVMRVEPHEWDQFSYKRDPREFPCPFHHGMTQHEGGVCEPRSRFLPDTDLPASWSWTSSLQTMSDKYLLFISPLVYGIVIAAPAH